MTFKLTHAALSDPSSALHARFDAALTTVRTYLGAEHPMLIGGSDERARLQFEVRSPADTRVLLGRFQAGDDAHAMAAVEAARRAFPAWSRRSWKERVALLRQAVQHIEERVFELGAVLALEVGKTRIEALGEAQAAADLIAFHCDEMERNEGYAGPMGDVALRGGVASGRSVMKPYGVWLVIAPFSDPFSLAGGPAGAALVAGNTVVLRTASATPWSGRLLALALRDAGIPPGVFNYVTGPSTSLGQALVAHPDVAGLTLHGSRDVGMHVQRVLAVGRWPRPFLAGMGGNAAAIVTRHADLTDAAAAIARSAFGRAGQACGACSRVYVEHTAFNDFVAELHRVALKIAVGDPARRENGMGPLIDDAAVARYEDAAATVRSLGEAAAIVEGGERLEGHGFAQGRFVAPTIARLAQGHPLWHRELFAPFVLVAPVDDLDDGIARANEGDFGVAAGFYGTDDEAERFFDGIAAGAACAGRQPGATDGASPARAFFGGWKGSGSTGRGAGSRHDLPQYLREQVQTRVRRA
jgi:1-pyrroline-5-carboxylate dehydrogenase